MLIKDASDFFLIRYMRHDKVTGSFSDYMAHFPNGENVGWFFDVGAKQGEDNIGF